MGRLRTLSGEDARRGQPLNGFVEIRRNDSHIVLQQRQNAETCTVSVTGDGELRQGTLASIIGRTGLPCAFRAAIDLDREGAIARPARLAIPFAWRLPGRQNGKAAVPC